MGDLFSFLRTSGTSEQKLDDIINYLNQFKEELEFVLRNISSENLSEELIQTLNSLGAEIKKSTSDQKEAIAQLSQNNVLTIYDVCNSDLFKSSVESQVKTEVSGIKFTVNYDTGYLEYTLS